MPANRGLGSPNWSPQPDIAPHAKFETAPDERVFNMYCETDIAISLMETDPDVDAYRWLLSEEEIKELAVESAQIYVQKQKELLLKRQLEQTKAARTSGKMAVVAGIVENLETGEVTSYAAEVPMGRAFG